MAEPILIEGFLDFLKIAGKYYYMHDLELRNLIDATGTDTENGTYEENLFSTFIEDTFYEKNYAILTVQPLDWSTNYIAYYILKNGFYIPNTNPVFEPDTYYRDTGTYTLLTEMPADWEELYSKYYFINYSGVSSNRETLSTSYVIFNALSKKLNVETFEDFEQAYDQFVTYIQTYVDEQDATKLNITTFEDFLVEFYHFTEEFADVAYSGSFNDLVDTPNGLGAYVDGTDLVFSGPSYGGMTAQEDENLAELIGSGIVP